MEGDQNATCRTCRNSWKIPAPGVIFRIGPGGQSPPLFMRMVGCPTCGTFFTLERIVSPGLPAYFYFGAIVAGGALGAVAFRILGACLGSAAGLVLAIVLTMLSKGIRDASFRRRHLAVDPRAEESLGRCQCPAEPVEITRAFKLKCPTCATRTLQIG